MWFIVTITTIIYSIATFANTEKNGHGFLCVIALASHSVATFDGMRDSKRASRVPTELGHDALYVLLEWSVQRLHMDIRHGSKGRREARARNVRISASLPCVSTALRDSRLMGESVLWTLWYEEYALKDVDAENGLAERRTLMHIAPRKRFWNTTEVVEEVEEVEGVDALQLQTFRTAVRNVAAPQLANNCTHASMFHRMLKRIVCVVERTPGQAELDFRNGRDGEFRVDCAMPWKCNGNAHRKVDTLRWLAMLVQQELNALLVAQELPTNVTMRQVSESCVCKGCDTTVWTLHHQNAIQWFDLRCVLQIEHQIRACLGYDEATSGTPEYAHALQMELRYWRGLVCTVAKANGEQFWIQSALNGMINAELHAVNNITNYHRAQYMRCCSEACRRRVFGSTQLRRWCLRPHECHHQGPKCRANERSTHMYKSPWDAMRSNVNARLQETMLRTRRMHKLLDKCDEVDDCVRRIWSGAIALDTLLVMGAQRVIANTPSGSACRVIPAVHRGWRSMGHDTVRRFLMMVAERPRVCRKFVRSNEWFQGDQKMSRVFCEWVCAHLWELFFVR